MRRDTVAWSWVLALALVAGTLNPALLQVARAQGPDAATALRARVEEYELAWNSHDPAVLGVLFTADADMLMGDGPRTRGRKAISDWWGVYFSRIDRRRSGTFTIDSMRLITPDVALINVDTKTEGRDSSGQEMPTRLARGTWVVVRQADGWFISAMRGQPAVGEGRFSPGTDKP